MIDDALKHILYNLENESEQSEYTRGFSTESVFNALRDCKDRLKKGEVVYYYAWW